MSDLKPTIKTDKPELYIEVSLEVPRVAIDALSDFICTNLAHGMVLADEEDQPNVGVSFYLPESTNLAYREQLVTFLIESLGFAPDSIPLINEKRIEKIEWVEDYRQSVKSLAVDDEIVIRPTWEAPDLKAKYEIIMEPKMAFGTGRHETTRLCLRAIRKNYKSGSRFLDYGCGSGVLSILADKIGAAYICAIDYDQLAIDNCAENFEINNVKTENILRLGSIERADDQEPFEFVAVNILKAPILEAMPRIVALTKPGGTFILSGLLHSDETAISTALHEHDQTDFEISRENDWLAYVVHRS